MSRLIESTLAGKISNILVESENEKKICPRCGKVYTGYPAISRYDNKTEICSACGEDEALIQFTGGKLGKPTAAMDAVSFKRNIKENCISNVEITCPECGEKFYLEVEAENMDHLSDEFYSMNRSCPNCGHECISSDVTEEDIHDDDFYESDKPEEGYVVFQRGGMIGDKHDLEDKVFPTKEEAQAALKSWKDSYGRNKSYYKPEGSVYKYKGKTPKQQKDENSNLKEADELEKGKEILNEKGEKDFNVEHADSNKISELENGSAFTFEGLEASDKSLKGLVDFLKEKTTLKTPVTIYTWSGKEFNDKYGLTGDNAYPDDLTFVSIALDSWEELGNLPILKFQVGARWLDDIVDNNARREGYNESAGYDPSPEELEADEKKFKDKKKKGIEDRIGELKQAIKDGVSDDEKAEMEKEIADLEKQLNECDKTLKEEVLGDYSRLNNEVKQVVENTFEGSDFIINSVELGENGTIHINISAYGNEENENGDTEMNRDVELHVPELNYLDAVANACQDWMTSHNSPDSFYECDKSLEESVEVATNDGSTVSTGDAASVQSNDGTVTVTTNDTTVVINTTPALPVEDVAIPAEEQTDELAAEVPAEEPIETPTDEIPAEEPVEEVPVEDEVVEESEEIPSDEDYGINATVEAKSLTVLKNQGSIYMLEIKETNGKTSYWVCENFNASTNEGDNAEVYTSKEEADKDYFERIGVSSEE